MQQDLIMLQFLTDWACHCYHLNHQLKNKKPFLQTILLTHNYLQCSSVQTLKLAIGRIGKMVFLSGWITGQWQMLPLTGLNDIEALNHQYHMIQNLTRPSTVLCRGHQVLKTCLSPLTRPSPVLIVLLCCQSTQWRVMLLTGQDHMVLVTLQLPLPLYLHHNQQHYNIYNLITIIEHSHHFHGYHPVLQINIYHLLLKRLSKAEWGSGIVRESRG